MDPQNPIIQFFRNHPWAYHALNSANTVANSHPLNLMWQQFKKNPNGVLLGALVGRPFGGLYQDGPPKKGSFI